MDFLSSVVFLSVFFVSSVFFGTRSLGGGLYRPIGVGGYANGVLTALVGPPSTGYPGTGFVS